MATSTGPSSGMQFWSDELYWYIVWTDAGYSQDICIGYLSKYYARSRVRTFDFGRYFDAGRYQVHLHRLQHLVSFLLHILLVLPQ
jgi:hypothetical protein